MPAPELEGGAWRPLDATACVPVRTPAWPRRGFRLYAACSWSLTLPDARPAPPAVPSPRQIKDLGCKAGVVLNPATPLEQIEYVLPIVDLVLIMSVNPGFGGQKFIESQVDKIRRLKTMCLEKGCNPWIEVDGGVTPDNAWKVRAGARAALTVSAATSQR